MPGRHAFEIYSMSSVRVITFKSNILLITHYFNFYITVTYYSFSKVTSNILSYILLQGWGSHTALCMNFIDNRVKILHNHIDYKFIIWTKPSVTN